VKAARVTVLGGTGFIGRHLAAALRGRGMDVYVPSRGDDAVLARPLGHVVYAIGLTSDFRTRPLDTVEAHVCVLRELLARADFDSLTYLSSTRVYAGGGDTRETARLHVDPSAPGDLYNLSKLMGESLCLHGGRPAKVARLSNVVGLRDTPDSFIDQLLDEGARHGVIRLRTTLDSRKDYIHVDDAVAQILALALSDEAGIFNIAQGAGASNGQVAQWIARKLGYRIEVCDAAARWDFPDIDVGRFQSRFGMPPRPFDDAFPLYLDQYRQHKGI